MDTDTDTDTGARGSGSASGRIQAQELARAMHIASAAQIGRGRRNDCSFSKERKAEMGRAVCERRLAPMHGAGIN